MMILLIVVICLPDHVWKFQGKFIDLLFLGVRMFMAHVFIQHEIKYGGKIYLGAEMITFILVTSIPKLSFQIGIWWWLVQNFLKCIAIFPFLFPKP